MNDANDAPRAERGHAPLIEKFALLVLFSLLLLGVYLVLKPFVLGLVFGGILAIATWPIRSRLVARGLSPKLAAGLLLLTLLLVVLVPVFVSAPDLAAEVKRVTERVEVWVQSSPPVPAWLAGLPLVGESIASTWHTLLNSTADAKSVVAPYAQAARQFLIAAAEELASSLINLGIAVFMATTFWASGDEMARVMSASLTQLGGRNLAGLMDVAANAVRGVFYGIMGTAAAQGLLMMIGLFMAGVPAAAPLGFVTLILALSQVGSILINLVWGGAAWWVYSQSGMGLAFWFVVVWGLLVVFIESPLKPMLIGARMTLPIILVLLGVFGGFMSFGFLGLFVGPTLLAVAYELLRAWRTGDVEGGDAPAAGAD
ncbi:MAG: AI-2E family transporter [Aestuariivirga sp.]|uniref:AI-2E family transporter n=1 Tax=Aestuariivirga sp. TaxID=2650926 RepID=UPI0038D21D45